MKKITISLSCYNEEEALPLLMTRLYSSIAQLPYEFEFIFTDNCSTDNTLDILRALSKNDNRIKVLVNRRNYGIDGRSARNTLRYVSCDALITLATDGHDPPEFIPEMVKYWEQGCKVICCQKVASQGGRIKFAFRSLYYKIIKLLSDVPQSEHISGMSLIDREVLNEYVKTDFDFYFRFALADMGYDVKIIPYVQPNRIGGRSSYNIWRWFSFAINSMVATSVAPLRILTFLGIISSIIAFMLGVLYLSLKLLFWHSFSAGMAPILIGMLFIGSLQLFFLGIIGEYIAVILRKVTKRPDVLLKETINI